MEEQENSLFQADSSGDSNGLPSDIPLNDIIREDPLDTKDETKLVILDHTELEMHQVCRGCLSTENVGNMRDIFIDDISSVYIYEKISNIKVEIDNSISIGMCLQCVQELAKIDKFVDMLKQSYLVLSRAAQEIKKLNNRRDKTPDLEEKFANKNIQQHEDDDDDEILDNCEDNFRSLYRVILRKRKIGAKPSRRINKKNSGSQNDLLRKRSVKTINKELPNICPLCSKKFRYLIRHLHSNHSLDWNDSKCLQCSFTNIDKSKLIEHCRGCSTVETEELKLELTEDSDFESVEIQGNDMAKIDRKVKKLKRNLLNKKYACNKCENIAFKHYEDVEEHLKTVHSLESDCILCDQKFTNSFSLLHHMMVKHGKLKCCRLCLVSFRDAKELNLHYKSEEHNTKCTVCGEQFTKRKALYEHRRKKHLNPQLQNKKYKCPECPKEFATPRNMERHIGVSHKDFRFLCDTCGQSYTTNGNLKFHIQRYHEGVQVQQKNSKTSYFHFCETCGKELRTSHKYAIAVHTARHKGHNFVCKRCYDSFPTDKELKKHVKELNHEPYECDQCQLQFVREVNYKIHLKKHEIPGFNKKMSPSWGKSMKLKNEKGKFSCSYCPKVFKNNHRLRDHLAVHTNERAYKCHICTKDFKTWTHWKTHLNIHLGIKKWVCKFCGKAFTNSSTLKGHEMIHTGERPHRCPECKKGFISTSALKKHRMVHYRAGGKSYGRKDKTGIEEDDKMVSEQEENIQFIYKYEQLFTDSDNSYESSIENFE